MLKKDKGFYVPFPRGQEVVILNTEWKPVANAKVVNYYPGIGKYKVAFKYPNLKAVEEIEVPADRVIAKEYGECVADKPDQKRAGIY